MTRIRVGHLYPDYLNIYADRGNIAVLAERAHRRGHELDVEAGGPKRHPLESETFRALLAEPAQLRRAA